MTDGTPVAALTERSRKLRDDRRRRRLTLGLAGFLILLCTTGAVAHVWVRLTALEAAYALGRARKEHEELLEARRKLKIEIGSLEDPSRVVTLARDELGMSPPSPTDIYVVKPSGPLVGGTAEGRTP